MNPATTDTYAQAAAPPSPPGTRPAPEPVTRAAPPRRVAGSTPDAASLLKALRRRWRVAFLLGASALLTVGPAAWYLTPPAKYDAVATVHVAATPRRILFDSRDPGSDSRTYQKTHQALITNQFVLDDALRRPAIQALPTVREQADPVGWLASQVKAKFVASSEVLEVSITGDRPRDIAAVLNALVESYMKLVVDQERQEKLARLDRLKQLRDRYQAELKAKRKALRALVESVGSHDPGALLVTRQVKLSQLGMAQAELMRANGALRRAEAELAVGDEGTAAAADPPARESRPPFIEDDPEVASIREQVAGLERRYRQFERLSRQASDPALRRAREDLLAAREELAAVRARAASRAAEASRQAPADVRTSVGKESPLRREAQVRVLREYCDALRADVDRLQAELKGLDHGGLDLENEREEIAVAADYAHKVSAEIEAIQVELDAPDRVRVLARARVPVARDRLRRVKVGGSAAAGAFGIVLLAIALLEHGACRIDAADEVSGTLGMRLVGTLPALPRAREIGRDVQATLVESSDATASMLIHAARTAGVRVVMVTSAVQGEGKTFLAGQLATSLVRAGLRTLLVDCDLRLPSLHLILDLPLGPGLCDVLRGESDVDSVIHPATLAGPDVITAGAYDVLPRQALTRSDLRALFDSLSDRYDLIIVDSPPVLAVSDTGLVGQNVDGVLFAVRRGLSRVPLVNAAHLRLESLGVSVLGAVIGGVSDASYVTRKGSALRGA